LSAENDGLRAAPAAPSQAIDFVDVRPGILRAQSGFCRNDETKDVFMTQPVWQKSDSKVDAKIMRFLAGDDVLLDREFFLYDITASKAHVEGLANIGVLSGDEAVALRRELDALAEDFRSGAFVLDERFEDGHSAIEARLTERLGDAGRKVHTGRSRNDQVLVATRLWLKEKLSELQAHCKSAARVCLDRAANESLPMPGYTHLQRAVVSSTSMWWAGFAEAFIDDAWRARQTCEWIDANPLGTAAGYGVNLALDRDHTTRALDFARMQVGATYAQLSRGKFEMAALEAIGSALLDVRRMAWDLSLFTTAEFTFVKLPPEYTTGSSIMPNKRNPDVVELLRASYASVAAARTEVEQLLSLPSGYQRDLQFSKGGIFHGVHRGLAALALVPDLLARLQWNAPAMRVAIEPAMYATDVAIEQAAQGIPFRDAYRAAAEAANAAGQGRTPEQSLAARTSPGAHADLRLDDLRKRLLALEAAPACPSV
jgi:argininosuccinate lyase